jgi:hypothetical protein
VTGTSPFRFRTLWLFAAMVLLLRAAVPAGWMPQADTGGFRVSLCSGSGAVELVLQADGTFHREAPTQPSPHDPCPFALAGAQALDIPVAPALRASVHYAESALTPPSPTEPGLAQKRALRPPTRGPPPLA